MPTYLYKARSRFGKPVTGSMEAPSSDIAAAGLQDAGFTPISIKEAKARSGIGRLFDRLRKVSHTELNMFTRQLAILQKAGLPILLSLDSLREQAVNENFKKVIIRVVRDVEGGMSLSAALEHHPLIFNDIYTNMVKVGETSGALGEALERVAALGEHDELLRKRITASIRYPLLVICTISIAFLLLSVLVIPRFAHLFSRFNQRLPLPTQFLIWINLALTKFWWLILTIFIALMYGMKILITTEKGRTKWDHLKLKIPVFGPLALKLYIARFSRITSILMRSGVPLLRVLELSASGAGNAAVGKTINNITASVKEGKGMSAPMKFSGMFPPAVVQMVAVGEQTGNIDELLLYAADYYEQQADYTIANLTGLIEPVLIFILSAGVLVMALGIFLPMWNMFRLFK